MTLVTYLIIAAVVTQLIFYFFRDLLEENLGNKLYTTINTLLRILTVILCLWDLTLGQVSQKEPSPSSNVPKTSQVHKNKDPLNPYYTPRLDPNQETEQDQDGNPLGSGRYGAVIKLDPLDNYSRAGAGHILIKDSQEPGSNGEKRPGKITTDPAGWKNYKIKGSFVNDRTHTLGYQFAGLNDDPRVLVTAGSYLNRGTIGRGSDSKNMESMLYYEQQLDSWLVNHPNYALDYYVKPIYESNSPILKQIYLQWVGIDKNGNTLPINIGGLSKESLNDTYYVLLDNKFPDYTIDYQTGQVTP